MVQQVYILTQQSYSDPDAYYTVFDKETFQKVQDNLGVEGWLTAEFEPITVNGVRGEFSKLVKLFEFVNCNDFKVVGEESCFFSED